MSDGPIMPPFSRDGRPLQQALAEDGFNEEFESVKHAAYRAHWESLAESIGLYKLISTEVFVEREILANIGVLPSHILPTEMPPLLREFVEFLKSRPMEGG